MRSFQPADSVMAIVWIAYKELPIVEWGARDLKDVIEGRPIYHQRNQQVEAHVFVATLALFLKLTLNHQPAAELPDLSSTDAFVAMESIGIAELSHYMPRVLSTAKAHGAEVASAKASPPLVTAPGELLGHHPLDLAAQGLGGRFVEFVTHPHGRLVHLQQGPQVDRGADQD